MTTYLIGHLEQVKALAASGRILAIGGSRLDAATAVTLFDAGTRKVLKRLELPTHVHALGFSGDHVIAGGVDGQLHRFVVSTGAADGVVAAHAGGVTAIATAGVIVATAGVDGHVIVWNQNTKQHDFIAPSPQRAVAIDIANKRVAAAGDDGVVRVFSLDSKQVREMSGHQGAVRALAFTPRDGRLASTGDDGTTRFWYLEGAVECEVRGEGDTGHDGGATAFAFLPSPKEGTDRLVSTGLDGTLRTVRLDDKKRTRTIEVKGAKRALALVEADARKSQVEIVVGGDDRELSFITVTLEGPYGEGVDTGTDGFASWATQLKTAQRQAKEGLAAQLPRVSDGEVLPLLTTLSQDREAPVRLALAKTLGAVVRRDVRPLLRAMVKDADAGVAQASLDALSKAEEQPFFAYRLGLGARVASVRINALNAIPSFYPAVPLVPGLVAGLLKDEDPNVRRAALDSLQKVFPEGIEALATGFDKGGPDVRAEVLVRALLSGKLGSLQSISGRALDDESVLVRQVAFVCRVLERPALAVVLEPMLELPEVFRRANGGKDPTDVTKTGLRAKLGLDTPRRELTQDDLTPLLVAMSAHSTDIASRGAAGLLFAANDMRAISALLQLSREEPAAHRVWVVQVLGQLTDTRARQRVQSMVDDADASVRAKAAEILTNAKDIEPLALTTLLLRSSYEDMRKRGLTRLVAMPAKDRTEDSETLLAHALDDESAAVRAEAFKTLWAWNGDDVTSAIAQAFSARFADTRLSAVQQLALLAKAPTDDDQAAPKNPPKWILERLEKAIGDRDSVVGEAAATALSRLLGKEFALPWIKGLESPASATRLFAAQRASRLAGKPEAELLKTPLTKATGDITIAVRLAALESAALVSKDDVGPLTAGLLAEAHVVRIRAAELLAARGDERIIEPMRGFILDEELRKLNPPEIIEPLRARATAALATLGSPRTAPLFADPLLKDENGAVREQAARGLCNAGAEGLLLDALGHNDVAVRSWAAEGLARLGDDRGLAVLTGTLRDPHLPIREGALRALVALGSAGDNALFLGLDDADDYLAETFFATLLARDLQAARLNNEPELLTAALSARRPDIRFVAARALELRSDIAAYTELLIEAVSPARPEKASDMKDWPAEGDRERAAMRLVQLLGSPTPQGRYLAGQTLLLRRKPLEFFAEIERVVALRPSSETVVPDTTQRGRASNDAVARKDWLRKLFASKTTAADAKTAEVQRWLAFGAYVGLLRLSSTDETVRRVRRDCADRMIALAIAGSPKPASVIPALVRALDDEDTLVRKKAWAGLTKLLESTPDVALHHALASASADVGMLALQQLEARGEAARPWFIEALASNVAEVRQHAFVLLERSYGTGSLDALMAALGSPHSDLRLGVLQKLAASHDARVLPALRKALESDRDDVRLLAAELLAERKDNAAVPALVSFLVVDGPSLAAARLALASAATDASAIALATHLQELAALPIPAEPGPLETLKQKAIEALSWTRRHVGLEALLQRFDDPSAAVRSAAFTGALQLSNHRRRPLQGNVSREYLAEEKRRPRNGDGVVTSIRAAAQSRDAALRFAAAREADVGAEKAFDELLVPLFADRDLATRVQAVASYAQRVEKHGAPVQPLEQVVAQGNRELLLNAAEGLATKQHVASLRPLLLFTRAGEEPEQVRAVLALGTAGQTRALAELEVLAAGGTEETPTPPDVRSAAIEALGRLFKALTQIEEKKRVYELVEAAALEGAFRLGGVKGLRWIADDRALGRLQQIVGDDGDREMAVRMEAVRSLGLLADPSSEAVLSRCLRNHALAELALQALEACFPKDPLRVALNAASSELPNISGPALAFLLAEAEPGPLIERLANPRLQPQLRSRVKFGLGRRNTLPTEPLVKLTQSEFASVREDSAWLMARHALAGVQMGAGERESRTEALVAAATKTAERWLKSVGSDKAAEERAFLRLLWAATLHERTKVEGLAAKSLAGGNAPASVRAEAARRLQTASAIPVLEKAAQEIDGTVRRAAVSTLNAGSPERAKALIEASHPLDPLAFDALAADTTQLASQAARTVMLPKIIATKDPSALMAQVTKSSEVVQRAALETLGRMAGENVAEFLAGLAFSAGGGDEDGDDDDGEDEGDDDDEGDEDDGPSPDVSMPGARRFEFEEDDSSKFWEVVLVDKTVTVRFGKIGAAGQKKPKALATPDAAAKEMEKLIREKTGKGYSEVDPRGVKPPKAVAAAKPEAAAPAKPTEAWGTPELREAAFRALRRAQRTNERRANAPKWFTAEQLEQLAADPALAESMAPPPRDTGGDDEDEVDDDYEDDEESDDE